MVILDDEQLKAIERMKNGCILCGKVGSGKSRTALAYYFRHSCKGDFSLNGEGEFKDMKEPRDLYIITTAKKRDSGEWIKECGPFKLSEYPEYSFGGVKVTVDSWNNIKKYESVKGATFILDEQRVVGYGSWTKAFLKISRNNNWFMLSATPGDSWIDYVPVFIANGFYRNKTDFVSRHAVYSRFSKYPKIERYVETQRLQRLRREILVEMNFKRKTESIHQTIISSYDKDVYKTIFKDRWNPYTNEPLRDANEMCHALRRLVNTDPDKIRKLKILLSDHDKCIIFYNFNYELDILREVCEELSIPYGEWNGHVHGEIPKASNWCYLVQYQAGAEAWSCIETDTMIFFSQNYSYKISEQARGRIDRANTPFHYLYYYHMRTNSPIDRSIECALARKKNFNESAFIKW